MTEGGCQWLEYVWRNKNCTRSPSSIFILSAPRHLASSPSSPMCIVRLFCLHWLIARSLRWFFAGRAWDTPQGWCPTIFIFIFSSGYPLTNLSLLFILRTSHSICSSTFFPTTLLFKIIQTNKFHFYCFFDSHPFFFLIFL